MSVIFVGKILIFDVQVLQGELGVKQANSLVGQTDGRMVKVTSRLKTHDYKKNSYKKMLFHFKQIRKPLCFLFLRKDYV